MHILKLDSLALHYGEQILFDNIQLILRPGDRLCVLGRNGAGKSTLLKTIAGEVEPDAGSVWCDASLKVASLSQELPLASAMTVWDYVASGLGELGDALARFEALSAKADDDSLAALAEVQAVIEAADGWRHQSIIATVLTRLDLQGDARLQDLSGGWRRRAALARALVAEPDVLLLDEPTNHLDVVAIEWLENLLLEFSGAVVFITHDRAFLRRVANRIAELDRGKLVVWDGSFAEFLVHKAERLAEEEKHNALFDKRLAEEEKWIRQGIKARRTRNEGRVRALKQMREERKARIEVQKTAQMTLMGDANSGKLVAECKALAFGYAAEALIKPFDCRIVRGDKIGLIGPNGVGKSTFIKLLLGELRSSNGEVKLGTNLSVAYFDQLRSQLDLTKSAVDNVAEGRDFIDINGSRKHIIGYLNDFLFTGERARTPLRVLSGGERNRVMLAALFSKPCNLLVMDEPTNDLDAETLELLEDLLLAYQGTLIIVSHDREFLDNVVTSTIAFEGEGVLREYVGGYQDWLRQGGRWPQSQKPVTAKPASAKQVALQAPAPAATSKKLSYKLQRELDGLPDAIERLEAEIAQLGQGMSAADFYQQSADTIADTNQALANKQQQLEALYARWQELAD